MPAAWRGDKPSSDQVQARKRHTPLSRRGTKAFHRTGVCQRRSATGAAAICAVARPHTRSGRERTRNSPRPPDSSVSRPRVVRRSVRPLTKRSPDSARLQKLCSESPARPGTNWLTRINGPESQTLDGNHSLAAPIVEETRCSRERTLNRPESAIRTRFVRDSFRLSPRRSFRRAAPPFRALRRPLYAIRPCPGILPPRRTGKRPLKRQAPPRHLC